MHMSDKKKYFNIILNNNCNKCNNIKKNYA